MDRRLLLLPPRPLPLLLLRPPPPATSLDQDEVLLAAVPLVVLEVASVPQGTPRALLLVAPTTLSRPVSCEVSRRSAAQHSMSCDHCSPPFPYLTRRAPPRTW